MDWCSLLTRRNGRYEPGAFHAHPADGGASPRPTLVAEGIAALARHGELEHPLLEAPGWWRREDRIHAGLRRVG